MKFPMAYLENPIAYTPRLRMYDPISSGNFAKRRGHLDASLVNVIVR